MTGTLYGVGVGPGDPELLTVKAARLIMESAVIAYLQDTSGESMARRIAADAIAAGSNPAQQEEAVTMPMCDSRDQANAVYDEAAERFAAHLDQGRDVVFLCQGDPFFFGSFSYVHERLDPSYHSEIVPGITAISACAALSGRPLALLAENVAVISGRRGDEDILQTLEKFDNVAIMKPGRRRPALLKLIESAGRTGDARYIEYAGQTNEKLVADITTLAPDEKGPYFSLFLVSRERETR